jgi:hypothetical protein
MRTTAILGIAGTLTIALATPRVAHCSEAAARPARRLIVVVSAKPVAASIVHASSSATAVEAVSVGAFTATLPDQRLFRLLPTWGSIAGHAHAGFSLSGRF